MTTLTTVTAGSSSAPLTQPSPPTAHLPPFKGWTHLELGAGNYGEEGYTKTTLQITLLTKIKELQPSDPFFSTVPDKDVIQPEKQYQILFHTLDQLVEKYGPKGVFHLNDLCPSYAEFAVHHLREYAKSKHYDEVIISPVIGDYMLIDPKKTLSPYGRQDYSSVHLKHPETTLYADQLNEGSFYRSEKSVIEARKTLQKLANLCENGLYFFINFDPESPEWEETDIGPFYHKTSAWEPVPYFFPNGTKLEGENIVWFIERAQTESDL